MKTLFCLLLGIAGLTAGTSTSSESSSQPDIIPQPRIDFAAPTEPVVFVGTVVRRLESPGFWAGYMASFQGVVYRVEKVESGPMKPGEQTVFHVLVGGPLCEDTPIVSRKIFRVGQRLKIKAERTSFGDYVGWEQAENVEIVK